MVPWLFKKPSNMSVDEHPQYLLFLMRMDSIQRHIHHIFSTLLPPVEAAEIEDATDSEIAEWVASLPKREII